MAVVLEIIDLVVCRKIHGCGCVADNPAPQKSPQNMEVGICGILDGYVVSSMSFSILKIISPSILDSTEVIHTGFML